MNISKLLRISNQMEIKKIIAHKIIILKRISNNLKVKNIYILNFYLD